MSNKNWILIFYYSQEKMFVLFFKVKVALESCKDKTKQKEKIRLLLSQKQLETLVT